jgi:hypothetical protein
MRIAAVAACLVLGACSAPAPTADASPSPAAAPSALPLPATAATAVPVHIVTKSDGGRYVTVTERVPTGPNAWRTAYELRALSSEADLAGSADTVAEFEQPHITFHDPTGKRMLADAPKATVTQRDKSVLMTGGVHARTQDGAMLTCDTLHYDGRTERIHGEGNVVLVGPNGYTLDGNHLDGDVRLDHVKVTR